MKQLTSLMQNQFDKMCRTGMLFRANMTGREVWDLYLSSFEEGDDPMFRDPESSVHNCNHCKNFIRRYGNIIAVNPDTMGLMSIFDVEIEGEYNNPTIAVSIAIKQSGIGDVFFETFEELNSLPYETCSKDFSKFKLGVEKNTKRYTKEESELYGVVKPNELRIFEHFHLDLPSKYVSKTNESIEQITAYYRDKQQVLRRLIEEISLDTLKLVRDLINQGSLLDGESHLHSVEKAIETVYESELIMTKTQLDIFIWVTSYKLEEREAKFKNTLIGVLCTELAQGEELNKACQNWNKRIDPVNYMKATAPITQKQIDAAQKFVNENGYIESFNRRFAVLDDIKVTEIKHINAGDGTIEEVSIFDNVKANKSQHKRNQFDKVEEVSIEKFMSDILPGCTSVEAFLANKHQNNLVSLTTSKVEDSKPLFKWSNNYSWTYNGNLAGKSQIKEAVKTAGGKVEGVLRASLMWAEKDGDNSDLDLHCIEPNRHVIYYGDKLSCNTGGELDIDITNPQSQMPTGAVENIIYPSLSRMMNGKYLIRVNQFSARTSKGFKLEIEFENEIFYYEYNNGMKTGENVNVATIILENGEFSIKHHLDETNATKELYGLDSNTFHKVNLVCLSPNHWGENNVGNKHYFFMLDKCKSPSPIRTFHNENFLPEIAEHRKVLEVLGATSMIESTDNQLSGLGFNATVRDELIVKVQGNFKRMLKIKF